MKRLRTLLAMVMLAMLNVVLSSCPDDGNDKDEAKLVVSPENISLDSNGEGTLSISTNGMWSVSTGAEWLTFSTMSGVGSSSITLWAIGNSTTDRTAIVTIKGESISRQVVVTQISSCPDDGNDKDEARLEVSPENISLDSNGEGTLSISTNGMWSVSTGAEWLTFSTKSGVGSSSITIRAIGNSTSDRTAIVTIKCESISRQVVVTQIGTPATPTEPQNPTNPSKQAYNVAGVSFNMVRVDGGTFWMGATAEQVDDAPSDEKPVHQVTLNAYYIGETEVTQELWNVVMGSNPSYFNGNKRPVEKVSWNDCQDFIAKLNQMTGQKFRLPTEAEWEFAARGGTKSQGYKYAGSNTIDDVAWYNDNSNKTTHDVGTKQANELGIYDMSGNVWEWCQDWYADYSSNAQTSPSGPSTGSHRVGRGGSWNYYDWNCRVSARGRSTPADLNPILGFRLALQ